jgi:hypothetical protein
VITEEETYPRNGEHYVYFRAEDSGVLEERFVGRNSFVL